MVSKIKQHCLAEVTHINGPPHSDMALMVSPAVPTTPSTPRGASRAGRREEATAVAFRRAKPPATTGKLTENKYFTVIYYGEGNYTFQVTRNIQFVC